MRVEFSGVDPSSAGGRQDPTRAAAAEQERTRTAEVQPRREEGPSAERSTRVTLSQEAKSKLAEEETGARAEARKAVEEKGAVSKLLEAQKERASQPSDENAVRPAPTRPSPDDKASIRAAEQRLASAGLMA